MNVFKGALLATLAASFLGSSSFAQSAPAQVYVIHGIPGQDLGMNPTLPVDVSVSGGCQLQGFTFGEIAGPLSLAPGSYDINVGLADAADPCSEAPVISAPGVTFAAGEIATVIAHLDANGVPTATKFTNDLSSLPPTESRILLHHTAAAPAVDLRLLQINPPSAAPFGAKVVGAVNRAQAVVDVPVGGYLVGVQLTGTETTVLGRRRACCPAAARPWRTSSAPLRADR